MPALECSKVLQNLIQLTIGTGEARSISFDDVQQRHNKLAFALRS